MDDVRFYMQRVDKDDQNIINIEVEYPGLKYLSMKGMNDVGKLKNGYTEGYADSDRLRHYLPSDGEYANEATNVELNVLIIGNAESRQQTYNAFVNEIRTGVHRFWDTARKREITFIVNEKIEVSDERWHGSDPYIEVKIPLQNLYGHTTWRENV